MLFTKKVKFSVAEKQIKEEMASKDGFTVLKLNLRYPDITCPRRDPLLRYAIPFYKSFAEGFAEYARTELKTAAEQASCVADGKFCPYSAVMRYEKTLENEKYLSFIIDISVSNGIDFPVTERKTQVWSRTDGTLCRLNDFVDKKRIDEICAREGVKTDKSLFVLRNTGIELFVRENGNMRGITVDL